MIRNSQNGFIKGKSCLTNLISFYDERSSWVNEGRAIDVVYLDFIKAFDTVSHNILIDKLRKCGLSEWKGLGPCEVTPGVLCPVLCSPVQKGHEATVVGSEEGYEDN